VHEGSLSLVYRVERKVHANVINALRNERMPERRCNGCRVLLIECPGHIDHGVAASLDPFIREMGAGPAGQIPETKKKGECWGSNPHPWFKRALATPGRVAEISCGQVNDHAPHSRTRFVRLEFGNSIAL